MNQTRKKTLRALAPLLIAGVLLLAPFVLRGVLIAPHAVFIDHGTRTTQVTLANPSNDPEEIEIDVQFGYPTTDSVGNPYVVLIESPGPDQPSAAGWIRAFPRRIRLNPGQRQVVRLLATPPAGLADGEYWTRLIVTSRRTTSAAVGPDTTLRAGLTLELRTIISVNYRKGDVTTAVVIHDVRPELRSDSLIVWLDLEREGNAAFLGTMRFTILDPAGDRTVAEWRTPVAVYYTQNRRIAMSVDSLPPGPYLFRVEIDTQREDLPQTNILPARPVMRRFDLEKR